ncbi:MAG: tetratricopeptide repeat protein [Chthoniobacterales bacterium]
MKRKPPARVAQRSLERSQPIAAHTHWPSFAVCLLLAAAVWVVFGQTLGFAFVNYDDNQYVYDNAQIVHGLTFEGVQWAFTHAHSGNWHPLTTLTHMFDCQVYGLHPWGHHFENVLLHGITAILLFLVMQQMTGALWPSAFVAAVFAVHPLHVESVAWISERKDVLSGLFFMLTLMTYGRYAQKQDAAAKASFSFFRSPDYWLTLLFFALGLLSKPMLVTVPFVLLLLDWWPLQRWGYHNQRTSAAHLVREKIPFLVLSAASCAATIRAQTDAAMSFEKLALPLRLENALTACAAYIWQMFYPSGLAVFYPHLANRLALGTVGAAVLVLLLISAGVAAGSGKHPYLPVGWLWYLGMLVPVIGVMQVGSQAKADRYTYLPQIGLYIMVAWGCAELCRAWRYRRALLGAGAAAILAALLVVARVQTSYWKNSVSLWTHALASTSENSLAHNNLGLALAAAGNLPGAIQHFEQARQLKPDPEAYNNLGFALATEGKLPEATQDFEEALHLKPDYSEAYNNLGLDLALQGKLSEAVQDCQRAVQLKPDYAEAHNNLGFAFAGEGKLPEAVQEYERAIRLKPDYLEAMNNLAYLLATSRDSTLRNGEKAIALSVRANQLTNGGNPVVLGTLAAAYAEAGRYPEAIETANRAIRLARDRGNSNLVSTLESQLEIYKARSQ